MKMEMEMWPKPKAESRNDVVHRNHFAGLAVAENVSETEEKHVGVRKQKEEAEKVAQRSQKNGKKIFPELFSDLK